VSDLPRFPALDPEPPQPSGWRRALPPVMVAALGGAVAAAVLLWPSGSASSVGAVSFSTEGTVVVWRESGSLALTDPDGTRVRHATPAQSAPQYPVRSPDGRYAVDIAGDLWALSTSDVRLVDDRAWGRYVLNTVAAQPFAGHDRYLALGGRGAYGEAVAGQMRDLRRHTWSKTLGAFAPDVVAGDPARPALYIADPVGQPVAVGSTFRQADSRVEYVTITGRRRTVLTADRARRALNLSGRVELFPWPAPDGSRVAIRVRELTGSDAGVIVINRSGNVDDTFSIPTSTGAMEWSRSGSLAVATSFPGRLFIWSRGTLQRLPLRLPAGEHFGGECQWSPDNMLLLFPTFDARGVRHWLLVRTSDGRQQAVVAPGLPVAWLGGSVR
jgi:hypothetical protein